MIKESQEFILIVDDMPNNIQIIGSMLSKEGYNFTAANNGEHALAIIEKKLPDLILLDIMMPDMDGYEMCKILKSNPKTSEIPIIFLTAKAEPEDIVKGFDVGGADYVTKPFNQKELLARIRTHLEIMKISHDRKELLHILCHDLANSIIPIVSILRNFDDPETLYEMRNDMLRSAENGLNIIDIVRKLRALEDHKIAVKIKPVPLAPVIFNVILLLKKQMEEKQIQMVNEIDDSISVYAEGILLTNSVIMNILTNAIKFSFPGSKVILKTEVKGDSVTLSIKDFGIGMSPQLQKDIFEMKRTTTRPGTNGELGTGFGMPLVKRFMNAFGGSVEIISKDIQTHPNDHGTEVRLKFRGHLDQHRET